MLVGLFLRGLRVGLPFVALAVAATWGGQASAQPAALGWDGGPPSGVGQHVKVWNGGAVEAALDVPGLESIWIMFDGRFVGHTRSAPSFVNRQFASRFPDGVIPPGTVVVVVISVPRPAPIASTGSVQFGDVCVTCESSFRISLEPDAGGEVRINAIEVGGEARDQFRVLHDCRGVMRGPCHIEVVFTPFGPDEVQGRLEVRHSGSRSPLVLPLAGAGTCPRPTTQQLELLAGAVGFGRNATGGADGCLMRVTSLADTGAGTLRAAAEWPGPTWIVFDVSGTIALDRDIHMAPDTTIDARGADITLERAGLSMIDTPNVVITNLGIRDATNDGIHIRGRETRDIWVSHVTLANIRDGYIDITQGATNITVGWTRFEPSPDWPQEKTLLIGAGDPGDRDDLSRVTLHHNLFNGTEQRSPLLRAGQAHSFNNYVHGWGSYGSGISADGQLLSEHNVYRYTDGQHPSRAFTPWDEAAHNNGVTAFIRSVGDLFLDGASGRESNRERVFQPDYPYTATAANQGLADAIMNGAGRR